MAKGKFAPGSLDSIHSTIRDKKKSGAAAAKTPLARSREQLNTKDLSDSSSSSSSDSSDDSGSDSDVEAERQKLQAKLASKKKPVEPKLNGTKSAPAKPTPDATKSTPDSDSDSESVSTRASLNKTLSADRATKQKTADESESESTSDSDSESDSESEDQSSKKNAAQPSTKADASSSEESDTSETSSSEDEDEDEDSAAKNAASKDKNDKKKDSASPSRAIARVNGDEAVAESSTQVARPQWLNGSDFMLRKASSDNPGKEVADFFTNANLEGKQLWYFTAPASLPITVLKDMEIDLAKVTSGGPLLKHEGDDYGLDLEPYATSTQIQLLIPSHGGDKYTALNRGIDSTVHLRRIAKFGPGGEVGATASNEYIPQPKPIREQPMGLKPRFTPIGVPSPKPPAATTGSSQRGATPKISSGNVSESSSTSDSGSDSDSDVEMTNAPEVPLSTPRAANGTLKRKLASDEQPPPSSAAKGTKSDGKAAKKPKSTTTAPTPSQLLSVKKETPVQPPNLSRIATAPTSTPSKPSTSKSKDKKDKKGSKDKLAKTLEGSETPVPPPSYLSLKR